MITHSNPEIRRLLKDLLNYYVRKVHVYESGDFEVHPNDNEGQGIDLLFCELSILKIWKVNGIAINYCIIAIVDDKGEPFEKTFQSSKLRIIGQIVIPEKGTLFHELVQRAENNTSPPRLPETIMLSTIVGLYPVSPESIIAIEKNSRNLTVYTKNQILKEVKGTLTEILKYCSNDFIYINRHCALNPRAITRLLPPTKEIFIIVDNKEVSFKGSRNKWKILFSEVYNADRTFWLGSIIQDLNDKPQT